MVTRQIVSQNLRATGIEYVQYTWGYCQLAMNNSQMRSCRLRTLRVCVMNSLEWSMARIRTNGSAAAVIKTVTFAVKTLLALTVHAAGENGCWLCSHEVICRYWKVGLKRNIRLIHSYCLFHSSHLDSQPLQ